MEKETAETIKGSETSIGANVPVNKGPAVCPKLTKLSAIPINDPSFTTKYNQQLQFYNSNFLPCSSRCKDVDAIDMTEGVAAKGRHTPIVAKKRNIQNEGENGVKKALTAAPLKQMIPNLSFPTRLAIPEPAS